MSYRRQKIVNLSSKGYSKILDKMVGDDSDELQERIGEVILEIEKANSEALEEIEINDEEVLDDWIDLLEKMTDWMFTGDPPPKIVQHPPERVKELNDKVGSMTESKLRKKVENGEYSEEIEDLMREVLEKS